MEPVSRIPSCPPAPVRRTKIRAAVLAMFAGLMAGCGQSQAVSGADEPALKATPAAMRRLSEEQYRNIIADVFGDTIIVAGHFDAPMRTGGLLAVGAGRMNMTPAAF